MHFLFLKQMLSDEIIRAVCWTLVHSIWEGLLLAIAGGVAVLLTRKSTPFLRYALLAGLLFLFVAGSCFTFIMQLHLTPKASDTITATLSPGTNQTTYIETGTDDSSLVPAGKKYVDGMIVYFNSHASLIVTIWFIIFSAQFVKLLANIGYIQRVRHYKTHSPSAYWKSKMIELAGRLRIRRPVALLESELIKVPMMAGLLKPVILFPFCVLSQLPPEQVEAILLHELAHIKRKDYLVNLLQSFTEIVFFFNPAVLWISSLIKEERENCCDDIAISETRSKEKFLYALVGFQEYNIKTSAGALAFPGYKNHLLNRVKRIITNNNKTLNNMEKTLLAACIMIIGFISVTFSQTEKGTEKTKATEQVKPIPPPPPKQPFHVLRDSIPAKKRMVADKPGTIITDVDGQRYKIIEQHDKVSELYINGKRIPNDKIAEYQPVVDKITLEMKARQMELNEQAERLGMQQKELAEQREDLARHQDELLRQMEMMKSQQLQQFQKQELDLKLQQLQIEEQRQKLHRQMARSQQEIALEEQPKPMIMVEDGVTSPVEKLAQASPLASVEVEPPMVTAPVESMRTSEPIASVIRDLANERLINDAENVSFTLNNEVLMVNNVKQSAELHQRFKEKYLKGAGDNHIIFSCTKNSSHSDVSINNQ